MNPAVSRSPSSQSDWLSHGGNTLGPMPSTLSVGDYNKLLIDTKRLMSTNQLPYVAKLTTDSSGEDSDRTNVTSNNTFYDSSNDGSLKSSEPVQSNSMNPIEKERDKDNNVTRTDNSPSNQPVNQHQKCSVTKSPEPQRTKSATSNFNQQPQLARNQPEQKVTDQLPPLSPPSVKKQTGPKLDIINESTQSKALMVNGTKYQPENNPTNAQQRPSFLTNFPRPSSNCGTSPVPYSRASSKTSPLSSSPKPYSPNLFKPIANSSPFSSSSTPTRHLFTPSPNSQENYELTSHVTPPIKCNEKGESSSSPGLPVKSKEAEKQEKTTEIEQNPVKKTYMVDNPKESKSGLSNLLSEVDERIRFSLDIQSSQAPITAASKNEPAKEANSVSKDNLDDQTARNMKDDLSKVKKDISQLKNELTITKQGLESGKQPLLVRNICCTKWRLHNSMKFYDILIQHYL